MAAIFAMIAGLATAGNANAAYPGRNGRVAYVWHEQIYTINADGRGTKKLTSTGLNTHPTWSPDGKRLAYVRETPDGLRNIWVMNADGSLKQQVTTVGIARSPTNVPPTWSPDSQWLVYGAIVAGEWSNQTALVKVRSSKPFGAPVVLMGYVGDPDNMSPLVVDGSAAWSPDGQHIVYYSHSWPDSPDNYVLSYNTSTFNVNVLLATGGECCGYGYYGDFAFSASGQQIGFTKYGWYNDSFQPADLYWFATVAGYDPVTDRITAGGSPGGMTGDKQPAFAPAGDRIVLMNSSTGATKLYVTDGANLGSRRFLTNGYHPDWQPLK